jgi:hypothetical protein
MIILTKTFQSGKRTCPIILSKYLWMGMRSSVMNVKVSSAAAYFSPKDKPYGFSFGEWTVRWWQWAVSSPFDVNPIIDNTGKYAGINQTGPVWFLAGTNGENQVPVRKCVVQFGKALLFPVINYEINQLEDPKLRTQHAMVKHVVDDINDIVKKEALVDGQSIPTYRVQSSPKVFYLDACKDNWLGITPGLIKAAADGYWVFLKPLDIGEHDIYFHGSCSGGLRNSTARYILTVSEQDAN